MPHALNTLRVLIIEDLASECSALIQELERLDNKVTIQVTSSLLETRSQLKKYPWDLVISGFRMKSFTALDALEVVRDHNQELPFILVSECIGEEIVADLMKAGVEDVVLKSRLGRLNPVVKRVLREQERKENEAKAKSLANQALAAKEQMLAIVSHDIKNPLSALQLEAQMLLRATERAGKSLLSEEVRIQANRILKTTDRMKNLISDLLDKNKSESSLSNVLKTNVDVSQLIQEVLDSLRPLVQEKEIVLHTSVPEGTFIALDRNRMFQVFSNLLNNALKFTPEGGTIQIAMEENDHELIFSVQDSGPGIKDKEVHKVFEKYWTGRSSQSEGTGLGLFICKTIVEAHDGHIFVDNVPGSGARFRFTIPKILPDLMRASFSYLQSSKDKRKKIYIIDDDEDLREVISWALGKEGYSIHSFRSPQEALACLTKGRHLPQLIVVDYHMDEMKGSEFVQRKDEILTARGCPVVMISASPKEVELEVPSHLYKEIITKPIDLEGLVDNVRRFLQ
ncbi:MAG: ATP-binding protein [Bacteriovoracia bacterium]